jgi:outer membrane cobalamin receptor
VTRGEIEARQWRTLADVLRNQPGVHVSQLGGVGQLTQVFFRGQRSGRVLLRIDGVDVSDPGLRDPGLVIPDLQTLEIERIELRHGPQGASAGSDAVGGVIDVVTRRGEGAVAPWAAFEGGSFKTTQQGLGVSGGNARVAYTLGYSNLHSAGTTSTRDDFSGSTERDGYENDSVAGRLDLVANKKLSFTLTGRFIRSDVQADRPSFELPFGALDFTGANDPADRRGLERGSRQLFLGTTGNLALWKGRWSQQWSAHYASHDRSEDGAFGRPTSSFNNFAQENLADTANRSSRLSLAWVNEIELAPKHVLRLGAEMRRESFERSTLAVETFALAALAQQDSASSTAGDETDLIENSPSARAFSSVVGVPLSAQQASLGPGVPGVSIDPNTNTLTFDNSGPLLFSSNFGFIVLPNGLQQLTRTHQRRRDFALFVEDRFTFGEHFFGDVGVRLNDQGQYGSRLSYRAGLGYVEPSSGVKLFANLATGFRDPELRSTAAVASVQRRTRDEPSAPSVLGAFLLRAANGTDFALLPFVIPGAESLEPEVTRGLEVGTEIPLGGNGIVRLGYFATRSRGVLGLRGGVGRGSSIKLTQDDILQTRSRGIELDADVLLPFGARLAFGYAYTHAELRHSEPDLFPPEPFSADLLLAEAAFSPLQRRGGDDEIGVPKHQGRASLQLTRWEPLSVTLSTRYVGSQRSELARRSVERASERAFMTTDLALAYRVGERFTVFSRVENVFDVDYSEGLGTRRPGRAAYFGVATRY